MNSRTVLVDPSAVRPQPGPTPDLPRLAVTRWVTNGSGGPTWTMTNPGLSRRHRRVAALAYAPTNRRVLFGQIVAPTVIAGAVGLGAGSGIAAVFASDYVPAALIIVPLFLIALVAAGLSVLTRWRQGIAQSAHVVQVSGEHAQALIDIEGEIAGYNKTCRHPGAKLSATELLWNAVHDPRTAIAIARTLAVLPPEEDVRVLDQLRAFSDETRHGPGNFTTLQSMVRTAGPELPRSQP
ncbi:MAG: hypothetical protein Q4F67_00045 [Propionibacteriaceae bacterium]|nr:hypothetical protein [Propionibacteriaceae bacterium]